MRKLVQIGAVALAFALVQLNSVNATELRYIITSFDIQTIVFDLPQNPIPDSYFLDSSRPAGSGEFTIDGIRFFADGAGPGGLTGGNYVFHGGQLYAGPENSPTL